MVNGEIRFVKGNSRKELGFEGGKKEGGEEEKTVLQKGLVMFKEKGKEPTREVEDSEGMRRQLQNQGGLLQA